MPASPTGAELLGAFVYFSGLTLERYLVFVGLSFGALWWLARRPGRRAPIQPGRPDATQLRREIALAARVPGAAAA